MSIAQSKAAEKERLVKDMSTERTDVLEKASNTDHPETKAEEQTKVKAAAGSRVKKTKTPKVKTNKKKNFEKGKTVEGGKGFETIEGNVIG